MLYYSILYITLKVVFLLGISQANRNRCAFSFDEISTVDIDEISFFSGTWYETHYTTRVWGEHTWSSGFYQFNVYDELSINGSNSIRGLYRGYMAGLGRCSPIVEITLLSSGRPGLYYSSAKILTNDSVITDIPDASVWIIYNDYETALGLICHKIYGDSCYFNNSHVYYMSRSTKLTPRQKDTLDDQLRHPCTSPYELRASANESCTILPYLTNYNREEGKFTDRCQVTNIPVQQDFSLDMILGFWYHTAMTNYTTYGRMDSPVSHYSWNNVSLVSHFTTSFYGHCINVTEGLAVQDVGSQRSGDLLGKIAGPLGQTPWYKFRVLYADTDNVLMYSCYGLRENGQCQSSRRQVELMTRSLSVNESMMDHFRALITDICIDPDYLQLTSTAVSDKCKSSINKKLKIQADQTLDELEVLPAEMQRSSSNEN